MEAVQEVPRLGTLEPFSGEPLEDVELPSGVLDVARDFLVSYFEDEGDVKSAVKVRRAHTAISEGKLLGVLPDGKVRIQGSSSTYMVGADCLVEGRSVVNKKTGKHSPKYCPTYQGGKQGSCYHLWMRELVRVAQVFTLD